MPKNEEWFPLIQNVYLLCPSGVFCVEWKVLEQQASKPHAAVHSTCFSILYSRNIRLHASLSREPVYSRNMRLYASLLSREPVYSHNMRLHASLSKEQKQHRMHWRKGEGEERHLLISPHFMQQYLTKSLVQFTFWPIPVLSIWICTAFANQNTNHLLFVYWSDVCFVWSDIVWICVWMKCDVWVVRMWGGLFVCTWSAELIEISGMPPLNVSVSVGMARGWSKNRCINKVLLEKLEEGLGLGCIVHWQLALLCWSMSLTHLRSPGDFNHRDMFTDVLV